MRRGEIWWASLPPPTSGPGFRRPVLVIQADPFNDSRIPTAIVAVIRPSVVNVSQVLTIDKALLTERVRPLSAAALARVDNGLRLVLGL